MPSVSALSANDASRHLAKNGQDFTDNQREMNYNLNRSAFLGQKEWFDLISKRNIYAKTELFELSSVTATPPPPDENTDVFWFSVPSALDARVQYFFYSKRYGKVVFAYDQSGATVEDRTLAFFDALTAQAIRE
jgi:hypothetical protein